MNTLLVCLAVPSYILVGLLVVAFVESADKPMSNAELWGCVLLWPIIAAIIIAAYILTLGLVIVVMLVSVVQTTIQSISNRKETK